MFHGMIGSQTPSMGPITPEGANMPYRSPSAPTAAPIWPRLSGPTGIRIGHGWVEAYFRGVPIAGMTFKSALALPDSGRAWLLGSVARSWHPAVAECVDAGGVTTDD